MLHLDLEVYTDTLHIAFVLDVFYNDIVFINVCWRFYFSYQMNRDYQVSSVPETSMIAMRVLGPSQQLEKCSSDGIRHGEEEYVLPCLCENQLYRSSPDMLCHVSKTNYSTVITCMHS